MNIRIYKPKHNSQKNYKIKIKQFKTILIMSK